MIGIVDYMIFDGGGVFHTTHLKSKRSHPTHIFHCKDTKNPYKIIVKKGFYEDLSENSEK